jgi:mono/diheme cytochrome c family protein
MNFLFHAHTGLRFLVLLAAAVALVYYALGVASKRPWTKGARVLGAVFTGLLDLQILVGVVLVLAGGNWYPAMWGHVVMMVVAAAVAHVLLAKNRKRPEPGHQLPFVAVFVALVCIVGGIFAIGRGPFTMTKRSASAAPKDASGIAPSEALAQARGVFTSRCSTCHGADGKGDGPAAAGMNPRPRDLGDAAWQASVTDEYLEKIIREGGTAVGKSPLMPANPDLTAPVVAAMREHVRSLKR